MDCRDPEYMDVRIECQSPYYEAYSDTTSNIHGNWIPAQLILFGKIFDLYKNTLRDIPIRYVTC
jgi:hypothetical protein